MPTIYNPPGGSYQSPTQGGINSQCNTAAAITAAAGKLSSAGVANYEVGDIAKYCLAMSTEQASEWTNYIAHMKRHGGECYGVIKTAVAEALQNCTPVQWAFSLSGDADWLAELDPSTSPPTIIVKGPAIPPA